MSSSQPASQPDSIDLAYDMWAGQFEFVGPTATTAINKSQKSSLNNNILTFGDKSSPHKQSTESLEDLNLNFNAPHNHNNPHQQYSPYSSQSMTNSAYSLGCSGYETDYGKQPILIDQETFLSLNPADFEDIVPSNSGPNSLIFIDNKLVDAEYNNNNNNNIMHGDRRSSSPTATTCYAASEHLARLADTENGGTRYLKLQATTSL
uniref:Uncharacterized protein n=1 Tax=Musca domestica TaxID=7370 RepID=T1PC31_MUSDO